MQVLDLIGDIIFELISEIWIIIKLSLLAIIILLMACSIIAFSHVITLMTHLPDGDDYCDIYNPELIQLVSFCDKEGE